ncbi:MAG: nucleoside monophosphate kinase [Planctomycetaceae bacterium]|jgi:adenylate kinase|nr:nucleoside monophosphate kinase [Planctomycetaceae bacterium]MBT6487106.1 nucleoside monophosphate kinase [Planctomycetaceae bacterium]MBT6496938.1 nucleoside monophosphate kinase [Planctomycetaceae bacterium]
MPQPKYRTVLMFGPPGVGKGTQGQVLAGLPGFRHVSSGDCFRALDADSLAGKQSRLHIERGELVPDDLTLRVWKQAMERMIADGQFSPETDVLILDGFPRSLVQAAELDDYIDPLCLISLVSFDEDAMVDRIKTRALESGRPDDADEAIIRHRFNIYRRDTMPVLKYYPDELKREVDALQSPTEVLRAVLDCIIPVQSVRMSSATN